MKCPVFCLTEIVEKTINNEQFWAYLCVEIPSVNNASRAEFNQQYAKQTFFDVVLY